MTERRGVAALGVLTPRNVNSQPDHSHAVNPSLARSSLGVALAALGDSSSRSGDRWLFRGWGGGRGGPMGGSDPVASTHRAAPCDQTHRTDPRRHLRSSGALGSPGRPPLHPAAGTRRARPSRGPLPIDQIPGAARLGPRRAPHLHPDLAASCRSGGPCQASRRRATPQGLTRPGAEAASRLVRMCPWTERSEVPSTDRRRLRSEVSRRPSRVSAVVPTTCPVASPSVTALTVPDPQSSSG
jgi:hypothetical protein